MVLLSASANVRSVVVFAFIPLASEGVIVIPPVSDKVVISLFAFTPARNIVSRYDMSPLVEPFFVHMF